MRKAVSRVDARSAADDMQAFVAWWSTAMWCAAAVYLLATVRPV